MKKAGCELSANRLDFQFDTAGNFRKALIRRIYGIRKAGDFSHRLSFKYTISNVPMNKVEVLQSSPLRAGVE
jgi:hypothetical protein